MPPHKEDFSGVSPQEDFTTIIEEHPESFEVGSSGTETAPYEVEHGGEGTPFALETSMQELFNEVSAAEKASTDASAQIKEEIQNGPQMLDIYGQELGLTPEESSLLLREHGFADAKHSLSLRLEESLNRLKETLRSASGVAATAFMVGVSNPAFAEAPMPPLDAIAEGEVAGAMVERAPLPSYEAAKQELRESIWAAQGEEAAVFVRRHDAAPMETLLFLKGKKVSVVTTDEEEKLYRNELNNPTVEIEMVHTHPLSAQKEVGLISQEQHEAIMRGEISPTSLEPSSQDWMMLLGDEVHHFPSAQISHRVIDATGEWEFGVSDSGSHFITGMRKAREELADADLRSALTPEELSYFDTVDEKNETTFHAMAELEQSAHPLARTIMKKLKSKIDPIMAEHLNIQELSDFTELSQPYSSTMDVSERAARVARMQELAKNLGFRLSYTPNVQSSRPGDSLDGGTTTSSEDETPLP